MKKSTSIAGKGYSMFNAVPFLLEMKVITEWFETKTSLGLFEWIKFQIIYGDLFRAKCSSNYSTYYEKPKKVSIFSKIF
jgi:hypothetical protein